MHLRWAAVAAERFRESIGQVAVRINNGQRLAVTVSAGVACAGDHDAQNADALYSLADQALYRAKKQGRDRVVTWTSNDRFPIGQDDGVVDAGTGLA